jgi:hypothetical protein
MAVNIKIRNLWKGRLYSDKDICVGRKLLPLFQGKELHFFYQKDGGSRTLRNVGAFPADYTTSYSRISKSYLR